MFYRATIYYPKQFIAAPWMPMPINVDGEQPTIIKAMAAAMKIGPRSFNVVEKHVRRASKKIYFSQDLFGQNRRDAFSRGDIDDDQIAILSFSYRYS